MAVPDKSKPIDVSGMSGGELYKRMGSPPDLQEATSMPPSMQRLLVEILAELRALRNDLRGIR